MTIPTDPRVVRAELCRRSFADFVAWAWPLITGLPYQPNRISTAIVETLQRVGDGELTRVLIACPPGVGKSTLLACYAAWRFARNPAHRAIHGGHGFELAAKESRRVRRLVEGDAYRRMFPEVQLRADENTAAMWATLANGHYTAVGVEGGLTGARALEAVVDDPLNAVDRFSAATKEAMWVWFTEALSTRLDGDRAPVVVVHQRLCPDDLIGRLLEADPDGWHLVELAAETDEGELLAPNVLPRAKLDALKKTLGAAAYATQMLQRPSSDATAVIKREWWRYYSIGPVLAGSNAVLPDRLDRVVIAADLTFGSAKGDYAVVQAWGASGGGRYLLEQWRQRAGFEDSVVAIMAFAKRWPRAKILVEKAANGAAVIETLQKRIPNVVPKTPLGNKAQRLSAIAPTVESGSCYLPHGVSWVGDFVEELAGATKHDDACDACAYAVHELDEDNGNLDRLRALNGIGPMLMRMANPWASGSAPKKERTLEQEIADGKMLDVWEVMRRR